MPSSSHRPWERFLLPEESELVMQSARHAVMTIFPRAAPHDGRWNEPPQGDRTI